MTEEYKTIYVNQRLLASPQQKPITEAIADLKREVKEFVSTRLEILRSEMGSKASVWKFAIPVTAAGIVLVAFALLALNFALIALLATYFMPSPFAWFFGALTVGVACAILGGGAAFLGIREIRAQGLVPGRTMQVLKEDQIWLEHESRVA